MKKEILRYKELKKIEKTFKLIKGNKSILGLTLLEEAIFCGSTLDNLKKAITADNLVDDMCQGNYSIKRENPALRSYNALIKNYQSLIKQINELLANQVVQDKPDDLENFIK